MEKEQFTRNQQDCPVITGSIKELKVTETVDSIEAMIMEFRGVQVMIDRDLAKLYGVTTKALNQAVKRNIERFPEDFMFQLSKEEYSRSQSVTLKTKRGQNVKYAPYVFTENGIAMLSGVLHSPIAIQVNILIMRTFTTMRHLSNTHIEPVKRIEIVERHQIELALHQAKIDHQLDEVFRRLNEGQVMPTQGIFFDGQVFDAHRFVCDLIRSARKSIVLFDNYVDDTTLSLLDKRNEGVDVIIYTRTLTKILNMDIQKRNLQYSPISVCEFPNVHDRSLCIDDTVYHIGASLKDLGKKWFAFSKMEVPTEWLMEKM